MTSNCQQLTTCIFFTLLFLYTHVSNTFEKKPNIVCFGKESTNPNVCSGNGDCVANGMCACKIGFYGPQCQFFNCFQYPSWFPLVCSSKGNCSKPNTCECMVGWTGPQCNKSSVENVLPISPVPNTPPVQNATSNNGKVFSSKVSDLNSKAFAVSKSTLVELPPTIQKHLEKQGISPTASISILTTFEKPDEFSSGITSITFTFKNGSLIPVNGLENPIQIEFSNVTFHLNSSTIDVTNPNFTCVYFDDVKQDWLTNGVETIISNIKLFNNNTINMNINCKTKHLTRFMIIDRNYDKIIQGQDLNIRDLPNNEQMILILAISLPAAGACLISCIMFVLVVSISLFMMKRREKPKPKNQP